MKLTERKLRRIIREEAKKQLNEDKMKPNQFFADADHNHPVNRLYAFLDVGPDEVSSVYIFPCAPDKTTIGVIFERGVASDLPEIDQFENQYSDILYSERGFGSWFYFTWDGRF
jgi:hypothetical protein